MQSEVFEAEVNNGVAYKKTCIGKKELIKSMHLDRTIIETAFSIVP